MKGLGSSSISNIHDFLQDAQGFLEQTLASEKLSRTALEHRTRLLVKLTGLMKEYDNHQMEMYIDMSPALRSFFHPSDSSTSDNSSVKDTGSGSEALYEVPVDGTTEFHGGGRSARITDEDQWDCTSAPSDSSLPETAKQKKSFMERFHKSTIESGDKSQIIYDDATTLKASEKSFLQELGASRFHAETGHVIYDDAFGSLPVLVPSSSVAEEYDLIDDSASEGTAHNNNDSDGISVKSGASEYGATGPSNTRWHVPASDTKAHAIRYGFMKRRNGRKLLSAWRRCYAVLLPTHLLMYAGETDNRPRIVIDLTEPQIRVSRVVKQGVDSKRLKTHPFVLLHEDKPLYEMSTKSREETDGWMVALQTVLAQLPEQQQGGQVEADNFYDIPSEVQQLNRVGDIQGRHLPSLPHEIPNDAVEPSAEDASKQQKQQQKLGNKVKATKALAILFRFPRSSRGSSEDDSSIASRKRQSVDSSTNTDDVYQELPSPARSVTPYSSVESLGQVARSSSSTQTDDIYHVVNSTPKGPSEINHSRSNSEGVVSMPKPVTPQEDELPVYDIPSPTVRPLSGISLQSETEVTTSQNPFARLLSQSRARLFQTKSSAMPVVESNSTLSLGPESLPAEVYDVPMVNPRRISVTFDNSVDECDSGQAEYDLVTTPPRAIAPLPQNANGSISGPAPKQKLARYWQDKISEAGKQSNAQKKNDSTTSKCCIPVQNNETKSVGRSFSRLVTPRTPLTSLTELLTASSNEFGLIKPSALRSKFSKAQSNGELKNSTAVAAPSRADLESKESSNKTSSKSVKKEPPPRPPAPARPSVMKKPNEAVNSTIAELNQQFLKRAVTDSASITSSEGSNPPSPVGEQYKARWAYVAQNSLELSINSGEIVQVLTKNGPCWLVKARNKKGLVPKEYLVPFTSISNGNLWSFSSNGEAPIAV